MAPWTAAVAIPVGRDLFCKLILLFVSLFFILISRERVQKKTNNKRNCEVWDLTIKKFVNTAIIASSLLPYPSPFVRDILQIFFLLLYKKNLFGGNIC